MAFAAFRNAHSINSPHIKENNDALLKDEKWVRSGRLFVLECSGGQPCKVPVSRT